MQLSIVLIKKLAPTHSTCYHTFNLNPKGRHKLNNYEQFYQELTKHEKIIGEKLQQANRNFKNITKHSEKGDVKQLSKGIEDLHSLTTELSALSQELQETTNNFDSKAYFESGEFARQMVEYCKSHGVDINGEAGVYEIFPFRLRIDSENQDLYVNRRKVPCMRPLTFVKDIKQQVDKYMKSSFNVSQFLNELAAAYDIAIMKRNSTSPVQRTEIDIALKDIYKYLAPTARARKEYDLYQYAYDLARLYTSGTAVRTKDDRGFELASSREVSKLIRILDQNGAEQFLGTIRFYK